MLFLSTTLFIICGSNENSADQLVPEIVEIKRILVNLLQCLLL